MTVPGAPLADPNAARAHARAMEGTVAEAMPILPPAAHDLPVGVAASDLLWEETIAPGGYASRRLPRGSRTRLIDCAGDASASILIFNADMPTERLNVADTVKIQWNAYLGPGKLLLSDMGRVMMSIEADGAQTHDAFCGASNAASNARRYGEGGNWSQFPNARDRLLLGAAKHGLGRRDVHPCVNLFKGVRIADDGSTVLDAGPFKPGRAVTLRAEMDVILVIANCPHVRDTRPWSVTKLRATAWRGPIAGADDPIRNATPEGRRAFANVDDYYRR
jgi:urea carboxylase-associated protein 2